MKILTITIILLSISPTIDKLYAENNEIEKPLQQTLKGSWKGSQGKEVAKLSFSLNKLVTLDIEENTKSYTGTYTIDENKLIQIELPITKKTMGYLTGTLLADGKLSVVREGYEAIVFTKIEK